MKKIKMSYPLLFALALALFLDENGDLLLLLAAIALHELGHLLAIHLAGGEVTGLQLTLGGLRIDYTGSRTSYFGDAVSALTGPGASLLAAWLAALLGRSHPSEALFYFIGLNLLLGLFNLLPVLPLDGGRALYAIFCAGKGPDTAQHVLGILTGIFSAGLLLAGVWLLLRCRNPSLLIVSLLILLTDDPGQRRRHPA